MSKKMPTRPRQHQLEDESFSAIRTLIPSEWVFRDLSHDYGIDGEIEVFDAAGSATGIKFWVQLKATDAASSSARVKRVWLTNATGNYYNSLDLPVLIARFHAPSKRFLVRWFHRFDSYYGKRSAKSISFEFDEADYWDDSTPQNLVRDVEAFREVRSPTMSVPIQFELAIPEDGVYGVQGHLLKSRLREASSGSNRLIKWVPEGESTHSVRLNEDKLEVTLGGYTGFTLHTPDGYKGPDPDSTLHFDILIAIGLALDFHGHSDVGTKIIFPHLSEAWLPSKVEIGMVIAACFARGNEYLRALEIAEKFFGTDDAIEVAQLYLVPFLARQSALSTAEREYGVAALLRIAEIAESKDDHQQAAVLNYNIGSLLRGSQRYLEGFRAYRRAASLDAEYLERTYFLRELGGILFSVGRYRASSQFYCRALAVEENDDTRCLYADALMFSGSYRAAQEAFERSLDSGQPFEQAEWALKQEALSFLIERTGLDKQTRQRPVFPADFKPREMDENAIEAVCNSALEADALSHLAWYNLGGVQHRSGNSSDAAYCFLMAALIGPWDLEAWGNAIGLLMNDKSTDIVLLGLILATSLQKCGEELLRHLAARYPGNQKQLDDHFSQILDLVTKDQDNSLLLRAHNQQGGWDEIRVPS
ncbi:MAG: DUF4365 domain-containing protein [Pseudomonadaceae bacterium]|nr:DUF4365 domain-containing protein [Pseudomonadaceae bacterium]